MRTRVQQTMSWCFTDFVRYDECASYYLPPRFQNQDLSHPIIAEILCRLHGLLSGGICVVLCGLCLDQSLIPSHVELAGNSVAKLLYSYQCLTWLFLIWISLVCSTTFEFWNWEQAACDWTKGECCQLVKFTPPWWDYYSLIKNWTRISYAWTLTQDSKTTGRKSRCLFRKRPVGIQKGLWNKKWYCISTDLSREKYRA